MKKNLLIVAALGGMFWSASEANAQETITGVVVEETPVLVQDVECKDIYTPGSWKDNWFIRSPFVENVRSDGKSDDRHITAIYNLGVGRWISPYLGFRFSAYYGSMHWNKGVTASARVANLNVDFMWDMFNSVPNECSRSCLTSDSADLTSTTSILWSATSRTARATASSQTSGFSPCRQVCSSASVSANMLTSSQKAARCSTATTSITKPTDAPSTSISQQLAVSPSTSQARSSNATIPVTTLTTSTTPTPRSTTFAVLSPPLLQPLQQPRPSFPAPMSLS